MTKSPLEERAELLLRRTLLNQNRFKADTPSTNSVWTGEFRVKCPHCGNFCVSHNIEDVADVEFSKLAKSEISGSLVSQKFVLGLRICSNSTCNGFFLFSREQDGETKIIPKEFPKLQLDGVPKDVILIFSEANSCYENKNFVAAGIMIRRLMEQVCAEIDAPGKNLAERLKSIREKVVISNDLFEAMEELRILGNDAAHIESKAYSEISEIQIAGAIELTGEILKAIWQHKGMLEKLRQTRN